MKVREAVTARDGALTRGALPGGEGVGPREEAAVGKLPQRSTFVFITPLPVAGCAAASLLRGWQADGAVRRRSECGSCTSVRKAARSVLCHCGLAGGAVTPRTV